MSIFMYKWTRLMGRVPGSDFHCWSLAHASSTGSSFIDGGGGDVGGGGGGSGRVRSSGAGSGCRPVGTRSSLGLESGFLFLQLFSGEFCDIPQRCLIDFNKRKKEKINWWRIGSIDNWYFISIFKYSSNLPNGQFSFFNQFILVWARLTWSWVFANVNSTLAPDSKSDLFNI